jgi:hypothetical protein
MGKKHRHRNKSKSPAKTESSTSHLPKKQNDDDAPNRKRKQQHDDDDDPNPLYSKQAAFFKTVSETERNHFFSASHVTPERRAELWMEQADVGEEMVDRYAWATPSPTCLKIFQEFSPIVEMGCGRNAYWANVMQRTGRVDVVAYDNNVEAGGVIGKNETRSKHMSSSTAVVLPKRGGPEVLELPENHQRTLFLCYPDEEDGEPLEDEDSSERRFPLSFGWQCLESYQGKYVIHVGELAFLDTNLSMDQAPWGRSSSLEFQQRLASEYHCLLKLQLPNWLHVRDSISVWKRSEICPIVFAADDDGSEDDDEEVVEYRHIPPRELLPQNIAAPCLEHLLPHDAAARSKPTISPTEKRKRTDSHDSAASSLDGSHKKRKKKNKKTETPTQAKQDEGFWGDFSSPW